MLNGLTVDDRVGQMHVAVGVRSGARTAGLQGQVHVTRNGVAVTRDGLEFGDVGFLEVDVGREGVAGSELPFRECRAEVEASAGVTVNGRGVTNGNAALTELDVGGQRVPVDGLLGSAISRWNERVEVLNLQVADQTGSGEFAARGAAETRASVQRDGKAVGPVQGEDQRLERVNKSNWASSSSS